MVLGVIFGFLAAFFQSLSYVFMRVFTSRHRNDIVKLLALSHIMMGLISIVLVPILWAEEMPPLSQYVAVLFSTAIFYILGQFFLFAAILKSEPSRVSPLLGLKILMLAVISFVFFDENFSAAKWLAVVLSSVAVFMLSNSGKKLEWKCLGLVLLACLCFSLSDLSIKGLVENFEYLGIFRAASLGTGLCYILCGIFGLIILLFTFKGTTKETWIYAVPFSLSWFIAMIFLFSCFGIIGVVFGNILQSTRGIISILMGFMIARAGYEALDERISRKLLIQRVLAALLMTGSVVLFLI